MSSWSDEKCERKWNQADLPYADLVTPRQGQGQWKWYETAEVNGAYTPMGSPSRGGGVSWLSLPTPFSPIFVCPSAYRNLSPVLLFTHQLLPAHLQFSSSDCPFCLHWPFTYISLLYKPSFCHFSFSHTLSVPRSQKMLAFWAGRKSCIYAQR